MFNLNKLQNYILLLLAFAIPLFKFLIAPILFLLLLLTIAKLIKNKKVYFQPSIIHVLLLSLYLLYAISIFWSANTYNSIFDLEVKLSLLVFPLLFATAGFDLKDNYYKILKAFLIGLFLAILICLINATFLYIKTDEIYYSFVYSRLSVLHHPSYFSMYINFALVILMVFHKKKIINNVIFSIFGLLCVVIIWLLMSRTGIITLFLILFIFWLSFLFQKKYKIFFSGLAVVVISIILALNVSSFAIKRFANMDNYFSTLAATARDNESIIDDGSRLVLWKSSVLLIKENIIIGVGNGDVMQELKNTYIENKFFYTYNKKLNSHNQFLQTWIAIGALGFIILISIIFVAISFSVKNRDLIALGFIMLITINFVTESMIETQSGVVFFSFFICLLFSNDFLKKIKT